MNKRAMIVLLVGVNLVLLAGLILTAYDLPKAHAQGVGMSANYMMSAGQIETGLDALYIVDMTEGDLTVVLVNKQGNKPQIVSRQRSRNLQDDLARGAGGERRRNR